MYNFIIRYRKFIMKHKIIRKTNKIIYSLLPVTIKEKIIRKSIEPFNDVENKYNIIFIHIPKTGGKALYYSLFKSEMQAHQSIIAYFLYDKRKFNKYFKFAVVRNPWDRFSSAYYYLKSEKKYLAHTLNDQEFSKKYLSSFNTIEEFILEIYNNENFRNLILSWTHFKPQYQYIEINGVNQLDYVGKFEDLENEFIKIKDKLGIKNKNTLIEKNKNEDKNKNYWEYYNKKTAKIIENIYKKDINDFGYSFPYEKLNK
jgi:chondroitin 4-sulfotransferase 11